MTRTGDLFVVATALLALAAGAEERRSGFDDMSVDIQAMQQDDFLNPGMLWVVEGAGLWDAASPAGPSCAGCHGTVGEMAGVAARYPAWDDALDRAVDLEERINLCRTRHQGAEPLMRESRPLLALSALVSNQSRGVPIVPPEDDRMQPVRDQGAALWTTPMGQLDLACANCHDDNAGRHLVAATIPEGHPTGYPLYRLEWQALGSLDRRLRNCLTGVRSDPFEAGSPEHIALKAYLAMRAAGMEMEAPAVRP